MEPLGNKFCALIFAFALVCVCHLPAVASTSLLTKACLGCISQAALSGCKPGADCRADAFRITWPYWADAGKLTVTGQAADGTDGYSKCINDASCAVQTVQNYMKKFAQDCNGDGVTDCYDYMAIHKKGGFGCRGDLPAQYVTVFKQCFANAAPSDRDFKVNVNLEIDLRTLINKS